MIWLTWRQFRTSALVGACLLAALAAFVFATGPHIAHFYHSTVISCSQHHDCDAATATFNRLAKLIPMMNDISLLGPALIGIFWGAPLVAREIETGSIRLAFTQSVTRTRWISIKLIVVGLASAVAAAVMTLLITWWSSPWDTSNELPFGTFDNRDLVPVAYALFAFALGVLFGVLLRRTVAAMALTFVVYAAATAAFGQWVRPHLLTPLRVTTRLFVPSSGNISIGPGLTSGSPSDWVISRTTINPKGHVVGGQGGVQNINFSPAGQGRVDFVGVGECPNRFPPSSANGNGRGPSHEMAHAAQTCINSFHLRQLVVYQPANRYWTFQWMESGIFVAVALGLAALTIWLVRRRRA